MFPAAGYGTRFLPVTKAMPKEMLPILNKPLIQYGVEEALAAGINHIAFVTGRGKRAIEDHFDVSYEVEHKIEGTPTEEQLREINDVIARCTFSYTRQKDISGLGQAILSGKTLIGNEEAFGVILADDLCVGGDAGGVLSQLRRIYEKHRCCIVAIQELPEHEIGQYGVVEGDVVKGEDRLLEVTNMIEKPLPQETRSKYGIIGRYILTHDIFDKLEETQPGAGGEIQITDALRVQASADRVLAYQFTGMRFDCGMVKGFVEATNHFYRLSFTE